MPQEMTDGINLDPEVLIQVLQNKLAQSSVREAQMESAIQSLSMENQRLNALVPNDEEVTEDASAEQ
jgi:hypothetical protein